MKNYTNQEIRKHILRAKVSQNKWAEHIGLSKSQASQFLNYGVIPKVTTQEDLSQRHSEFLKIHKLTPLIKTTIKPSQEQTVQTGEQEEQKEYNKMQHLTEKAKQVFKFRNDPFWNEVETFSDIWRSLSVRYVRSEVIRAAEVGGMIAIIGESGSGKTTIVNSIEQELLEQKKIKVVRPRLFDKSKLSVASICNAIIADLSTQSPKHNLEKKSRQVEEILLNNAKMGYSALLILEEAHDADIKIFKLAKRLNEVIFNHRRALGFVFVGQPELKLKFSESEYDAREMVARTMVVDLKPIQTAEELSEYLAIKFKERNLTEIIENKALEAILAKFTMVTRNKNLIKTSHPLAINNLIKKAMNEAAELGKDIVDEEVINEL